MKKFVIFLVAVFCTISLVEARDYTKLQIKEMKKAQKYGTTQFYLNQDSKIQNEKNVYTDELKDPKIMKIGNYDIISESKYNEKIKKDEKEYAKAEKFLRTKTWDNYNAQAKGSDYYHIYRIAEKIIRANNLDYITWRIGFTRSPESVNAYNTSTNYIDLTSAMYDTFADNDDALAMVIGHEMGHSLLGHQKRDISTINKAERMRRRASKSPSAYIVYIALQRKLLIDSKNEEYAADVEGAKLAMKAGYSMDKAVDVLNFFNTLPEGAERYSSHPSAKHRIQNVRDNAKYFPEKEWNDLGRYNIYNSDVLKVNFSSDRKSLVISPNPQKNRPNGFYVPESLPEIYARMGYKAYTNREFEKSIKYFNKMFKIDKSNASAYLYASYASEALYKKTGKQAYLDDAKVYAQSAKILEPRNDYILEQINNLQDKI